LVIAPKPRVASDAVVIVDSAAAAHQSTLQIEAKSSSIKAGVVKRPREEALKKPDGERLRIGAAPKRTKPNKSELMAEIEDLQEHLKAALRKVYMKGELYVKQIVAMYKNDVTVIDGKMISVQNRINYNKANGIRVTRIEEAIWLTLQGMYTQIVDRGKLYPDTGVVVSWKRQSTEMMMDLTGGS
jgi:hypothetical protein